MADGRIEIVLHLAAPFARLDPDGVTRLQAPVVLAGQMTAPLFVRSTGMTDMVGIRFRTAAAASFLRVPLAELTDRVEPLADCDGNLAAALRGAASRGTTPEARVAALSRVLLRAVVAPPDRLTTAVIRSLDAPHAPRVRQAADACGLSARTLERKVLASTGLAPSRLRRVLRFRRAFRMLDGAPPGTWTRVALEAGYYDQPHLVREFRGFAGVAPSQFFRTDPDLARAIMGGE